MRRTSRRRDGRKTVSASAFTTQSWRRKPPSRMTAPHSLTKMWVLSAVGGSPLKTHWRRSRMAVVRTVAFWWYPSATDSLLYTAYPSQAKMPQRFLSCVLIKVSSPPCGNTSDQQKSEGLSRAASCSRAAIAKSVASTRDRSCLWRTWRHTRAPRSRCARSRPAITYLAERPTACPVSPTCHCRPGRGVASARSGPRQSRHLLGQLEPGTASGE
mmetsp:Transcript_93181/g.263743  ORF Transcript_93181/g.263743 Transcript_93181/m.263743 type:complete len:214 (+) Transcript_93181:139-780(+)